LARLFASLLSWFGGNPVPAREQAAALLVRAEQLRDRRWRVSALWLEGTIARYSGDLTAALDMIERGLSLQPEDPHLLWTRALMARDLSDAESAGAVVRKLLHMVPLTPAEPSFAQATTLLVLAQVSDAARPRTRFPWRRRSHRPHTGWPTCAA
jgi:hypothetical protein